MTYGDPLTEPIWVLTEECDWGDCTRPAVTRRYDEHLGLFLPVCLTHAQDDE